MSVVLYGQYPRSESLVQATRDFDRGRTDAKALALRFEEDRASFLKLQEEAEYLSSGLFHWDDLMRPFASLIEGSRAGTLTRFLETNTFWRIIDCSRGLRVKEDELLPWVESFYSPNPSRKNVFTLPFLFLFRDFSAGLDVNEIGSLLYQVAAAISKHFDGLIIFFDPSFGWREIDAQERKAATVLVERIKRDLRNPLALMTSFFSVEKEKNYFFDLPFDMFGADFYRNRVDRFFQGFPADKALLAGVIGTDSTAVEKKDSIQQFMKRVAHHLSYESLYFTTSCPAELLPREVMDRKLAFFQTEFSR